MERSRIRWGLLASLPAICSSCSRGVDPATLGLRNFAAPLPGIYTSGQPTEAQLDALQGAGIRRVVHLRAATENGTGWEERRAVQAGVEFVRLAIDSKNDLTREQVERFRAMLQASDCPTLVSCGSSDRVGAMFALQAFWLDGESADAAIAVGRSAGLRMLEAKVRVLVDAGR